MPETNLLEEAVKLSGFMRRTSQSLGATKREVADELRSSVDSLIQAGREIEAVSGASLESPIKFGSSVLPAGTPLSEAKAKLSAALDVVLETVQESDVYKALKKKQSIPHIGAEEIIEKSPSFINRVFFESSDKLEKYLSEKSIGGKLGIAATGIVLGGVLMQTGGNWFSRGLEGKEVQLVPQEDGSIAPTITPINPTKRTAEILGGAIAGATGIAAEIVGFFSAYKAFTG